MLHPNLSGKVYMNVDKQREGHLSSKYALRPTIDTKQKGKPDRIDIKPKEQQRIPLTKY